jgi:ABC-2 type transport system ATP-binding protein
MISTFQAIKTLELVNEPYLNQKIEELETINIIDYLVNSLNGGGWGFKLYLFLEQSDIISTYSAIELCYTLSANSIIQNQNIKKFINSTWIGGAYSYSNDTLYVTPETTYLGIKAFLAMNMTYNNIERNAILAYFNSIYNPSDGGYINPMTGTSDVRSTYYSISSLEILGLPLTDENKTLNFILNCSKNNGGFGAHPNPNIPADFTSGWAAMKSIGILEKLIPINIEDLNEPKINYYNWTHNFQAKNTLFGDITLESNYYGVFTLFEYNQEQLYDNLIGEDNIIAFLTGCYNIHDGGFGSKPSLNATLFDTFCALNILNMLFPTYRPWLPNNILVKTINYISGKQNPDGGFKAGDDIDNILSSFGSHHVIFLNLINENKSTVESTYWALISLDLLYARYSINRNTLNHWIRSCQNADGGFSTFIGYHSDVISTYYGLEVFFQILVSDPESKIAAIEFLKNSQTSDGSFNLLPMSEDYLPLPSSFLATYFASKALYDYRFQPEQIKNTLMWFVQCISPTTGGLGDNPGFGGDLRNAPYGMIIIDELKYDQNFDSKPWNELLIYILLVQSVGGLFIILYKGYQKLSIPQRLKLLFRIDAKMTPFYLKKFDAIICENLNVFAGRKLIVDSVNMRLKPGKILGILGESGAGKSTFIKGLLGMRKITGFCQLFGLEINKKNASKLRPFYGYVPQDLGKIYHNFTTLENLLYFGKQYGLTEKEVLSRGKRILRSLDINEKANELVKNLSGGEKRRVSIAIGLIHSPLFLILDEPTSGLDPIIRENLWLTLTKINEQFKTTLVVITHYPEESRFCNFVGIFGRNRGMIDFGKPSNLLTQLPGKGRSIEITFFDYKKDAIERLESIIGIEKVLENKVGTDFSIFTDLNLNDLSEKIESEMGENSIQKIKQSDSKMEQYFRFKALEVPKIEEF